MDPLCFRVFVVEIFRALLNFRVRGRANAQLLALIQTNIFAALSQHARSSHARPDRGSDCRARAASRDQTDDRADAGGPPDLLDIAFS